MGGEAAPLAEVAKCGTVLLAVFTTDQVEDVTENTLVPAAGAASSCFALQPAIPTGLPRWRPAWRKGHPFPRNARVRQQRPGQPRRGHRVDRWRSGCCRAGRRGADRALPKAFSYREGGRRRPRQARHRPDPRPAPDGAVEGLVFAERLGLDPKAFLDVARNSAAYSQVMDIKGGKMVTREYKPEGFIHQTLKDFSLAMHGIRDETRPDAAGAGIEQVWLDHGLPEVADACRARPRALRRARDGRGDPRRAGRRDRRRGHTRRGARASRGLAGAQRRAAALRAHGGRAPRAVRANLDQILALRG